MAATTARSATRSIVVLVDLSPNRRASTIQDVEATNDTVSRVESYANWGLATAYAGLIPRFGYFAECGDGSAKRTRPRREAATPTKAPVLDRPIEEGVR